LHAIAVGVDASCGAYALASLSVSACFSVLLRHSASVRLFARVTKTPRKMDEKLCEPLEAGGLLDLHKFIKR